MTTSDTDPTHSLPSPGSHLSAPSVAVAPGLTRDYLYQHRVCPHRFDDHGATLVVAAGPNARLDDCLDELMLAYRCAVRPEPVTQSALESMIERLFADVAGTVELSRVGDGGYGAGEVGAFPGEADDDLTADVRDLAAQPPVVRYVNFLVREAFDAGASDIHLEATRAGPTVRMRLDGVLTAAPPPPAGLGHAVVSRLKLLAELDIAERRRPQDGRIRVRLEARELDLRVSTVPTAFGESIVLRLLDRGGRPVSLEELGMPAAVLQHIGGLALRPHGLLLVTGPTGSGKTTTLYACLQRRNTAVEKIITVEDPIEYQLAGVTQVPVHAAAGVTFGSALRAILRQDPDVVMVGEMRDSETADIAVQAGMTGHLVFSTLHTNDAVGAVPRLLDLGVPSYLVAATLEGVVAQRLVRRVCDGCRVRYIPSPDAVAALGDAQANLDLPLPEFTRGVGCPACRGTGFRGRIGLYELLLISDEVKDAIVRGRTRAELRRIAGAGSLLPLQLDGYAKACSGITTLEEVLRVAQA